MINRFFNSFFRITTSGKYIPEVDSIRFVAIFSVLCYHSSVFYVVKKNLKLDDTLNHFFANGYVGVYLFFVLSGYILSIPFANQISEGRFDIKNSLKGYYLRRLTRLEPPYLISLLFFFVVLVFVTHKYTFGQLLPHLIASIFYLSDIIFHTIPVINVPLWTLEIEVQFYLIAPFLCFLIFKKISNHQRRVIILVVTIFLVTFLQAYVKFQFKWLWQSINFFITGILLTELLKNNSNRKLSFINRFKNSISIALLLILFFVDYAKSDIFYHIIINFLILGLFILILKYKALQIFFTNKYICIIGGACYSIYLIHYPIISFVGNPLLTYKFSAIEIINECINMSIHILIVLILSMCFFKLFERPFMDKAWPQKLLNSIKLKKN